jgi:hypothetical protein
VLLNKEDMKKEWEDEWKELLCRCEQEYEQRQITGSPARMWCNNKEGPQLTDFIRKVEKDAFNNSMNRAVSAVTKLMPRNPENGLVLDSHAHLHSDIVDAIQRSNPLNHD